MSGMKLCPMPVVQLLLPAAMPRALMTPDFLVFFLLHLLFLCLFYDGGLQESNRVDWGRIRALSACTISIELVFVSQCYWRFDRIRTLLRGMMVAIYEFAYLTRLFIRPSGKPYDRLACRYVVAAVLLYLVDADGTTMASQQEWQHLVQVGLVKREEVHFLGTLAGQQRLLVMLHVAGDIAKTGIAEAASLASQDADAEITRSLLKLRAAQDELQALLRAVMPFAFENLVAVLVIATLALWAYNMAFHLSLFAPVIFGCGELLLLGMMEVTYELLHPFREGSISLLPVALTLLQNVDAVLEYAHAFAETNYQADLEDEAQAHTQFSLSLADVEDFFGIKEKRGDSAAPPAPAVTRREEEAYEEE